MGVLVELDGVVGARHRSLQVAHHGLMAWNCVNLALTLLPVTMRSCRPAPATAVKHHKPSDTTVSGRVSDLAANSSTACLVNGFCAKQAATGLPSSVV